MDTSPGSSPDGDPVAQVSIIVIAHNEQAHVRAAVSSALCQGPTVHEVIAVDDASTDATGAVLARIAATDTRLRVLRREQNSGGCGTPRNDGLIAATGRYVMFLDGDDVLAEGAVAKLLAAAHTNNADVAIGACVRRELPEGRDVPWQPRLFRTARTLPDPEAEPGLIRDTLCVNKLYTRDFLTQHSIRFPEGAFRYEDFVFSARVLAAGPRCTLITDTVYVWHVRREAARPSLSLDRGAVTNWEARLRAHRESVDVLEGGGRPVLARAARTKFLDHDLRMYLRELHTRHEGYRSDWWRLTREYLSSFSEREIEAARAPSRWCARVVLAAEEPTDLTRLTELAARPARLIPPYTRRDGRAVWTPSLPQVELDGILAKPLHRLPVTVTAEPEPGRRSNLVITLHDLYGRLASATPRSVVVDVFRRTSPGLSFQLTGELVARPQDGTWRADLPFDVREFADGPTGAGRSAAWDLRVTVRFDDGRKVSAVPRLPERRMPRRVLLTRRGLLLLQPYRTTSGDLAIRVAWGLRGAVEVAAGRLRRFLRR
ncbi:glycosyltransferase family 2 protein [Streptomyces sp. NPDC002205]|uniref:glycosyltransferase family 2 protein n=1 Tax=Streptomyces sp. NPDC002205 TaxID=3154411 RepID=UPI0033266619